MSFVVDGVVMKRPDHDVCVETREADEKSSRTLVLKTWSVDAHFVERQVVRLTGDVPGGERTIDHRGVRGEELHVIDRFEVSFGFNAVPDLNRSEAPRIRNYQIGRSVSGRTEQITCTRGRALRRERLRNVAVAVDIKRADEGARDCAGKTTRHAGRE